MTPDRQCDAETLDPSDAVSDTTIRGRHSLRVAICNHRTLTSDLDQLRAEILRIGGILT